MRNFSVNRLSDFWDGVRTSYWLLPALMVLGAIGLAVGMSYLDLILPKASGNQAGWATALKPSAARTILSTLAGSMATIVGVVFSITIVALQLASSQFGPHVLRSFLSDRGSQAALGTLLGTFTYALLAILVSRGGPGFVPYGSTYAGIALGIVAIAVLIYFINHVSQLIRAESVVASLARELAEATEDVFPDRLGEANRTEREATPIVPACFDTHARPISAAADGYIRGIDDATLMRVAEENDLLIRLDVRPGDFVVQGALLMAAAPSDRVDERGCAALRDAVLLGIQRTPRQDIGFALQHLQEVAIRSLSPAINAPYIAMPAIDQIAAGLCRLAGRRIPSLRRKGAGGTDRVLVMRGFTLAGLARNSFGPIASSAAANAEVMARLIGAVKLVGSSAHAEEDRRELTDFAGILSQEAESALVAARDRDTVRAALQRAVAGHLR